VPAGGVWHDRSVDVYLQTRRLVLRRFTPQDVDLLFDLDNDPAVMRYLNGGRPADREAIAGRTLPAMLARYDRSPDFGYWAAHERVTGEFLGWFALHPSTPPLREVEPGLDDVEIGYRLRRMAWGRGYATEGARALVDRAFGELGVRRIFATTMTVNAGSRAVMTKIGMSYLRTFHEDWPDQIEGGELGDVEYELRREDWRPTVTEAA
jgi:RimJ/RimL family protein N-acetyltransferase